VNIKVLGFVLFALLAAPRIILAGDGFEPEDFYRVRSVADAQFSPDGSRIAFVVSSVDRQANRRRFRVWLATVADGSVAPLTPENADDTSPRWSPDGRSLATLSSVHGKPAVVVTRMTNRMRSVAAFYQTSNDPLAWSGDVDFLAWSPDGKRIAYLSADPGPEPPGVDPYVITRLAYKSWMGMCDNRRWHIYLVTLAGHRVVQLTRGDRHEHSISWSPSGDEIAFVSNHEKDMDRVHNYDLFAVKIADGSVRQITRTPGCEFGPHWSPDGRSIAYFAGTRALTTREVNAEDGHLWLVPASGGPARELAPTLDRRVLSLKWTPDSSGIYFMAMDQENTSLYRVARDGSTLERAVTEAGNVNSFTISKDRSVGYAFTSPISPAELFVQPRGGPPRQLTHLNSWLGERRVSPAKAFEFPSFDGTRVQGFITPPASQQAGRKYPVVLMIHGGPHWKQGVEFNLQSQVYASHGYSAVAVNYRGSTGYGQKFSDGTIGDQDGSEAKDVLAGLDYALANTPYMDGDRLGIEGGSYGGQLTNWIITQTPRFKAAIPASGISNLIQLAYTIWAPDYMRVEYQGYPWERDIAARLWERSPLAHIANVKTPTMFVHGELDEDVTIAEPEQMFIALKELGIETVFLRYPREGHGMHEPAHEVDKMKRSLDWYARWLSGGKSAASAGKE
jgi:dipeptidyl aminopeptidase/acylaminoacyl peptidase